MLSYYNNKYVPNTEVDTRRSRAVAVKNLTLFLFVCLFVFEECGRVWKFGLKYFKQSSIVCPSRSLECELWKPGPEVSEGNKDFMTD